MLTDDVVAAGARARHIRGLAIVPLPSGERVRLKPAHRTLAVRLSHARRQCFQRTASSLLGLFLHGTSAVSIDHRALFAAASAAASSAAVTVREADASEADVSLAAQREALAAVFSKYAGDKLAKSGLFGCSVGAKAGNGFVSIAIAAERLSLPNFWVGKWASQWKVNPVTATISGSVHVTTHYYENGNVQLHCAKQFAETALPGAHDAASVAAAAVRFVAEQEDAMQTALAARIVQMSSDSFKDMRRRLPLSGTKMNWHTTAHSMVRAMRK